jgi:hypothetical protein
MADIKDIVDRVMALQDLTRVSGTITNRAQGRLLQTLSEDDLTAVAQEIAHRRRLHDILSGVTNGAK